MESTQNVPFGIRDAFVALIMNFAWGLNIIAAKMAVVSVQPVTAAWLRMLIVLIVCGAWLRIVPGRMRELLLMGVLSGGLFFLIVNLSLMVATNVSALAIAGQLGVPFSMILSVLVFRERIHKYRIFGVALSFAGVAMLVFDPKIATELPGIALTALASLVWACSSLVQRRLKGVPILTIYAWIGLFGAATLAPLAILLEPSGVADVPELPLKSFGWIAFSAIGSTVVGHGSMSWLLQRHPISQVVPLTLAAPIISVVAASLFFRTPITAMMVAGGMITLVGVAIVSIRTAKISKETVPLDGVTG